MKRKRIIPVAGQIYRNRNGNDFICKAVYGYGKALMERIKDGWTLVAHGIQQYQDSTIEWDYSTGGHWAREG